MTARLRCFCGMLSFVALVAAGRLAADEPSKWLSATAYAIPKECTNQGSGYFSIVTGKNNKLYIGTAKYGVGSYLVEFDPKTEKMKVVVDTMKEIGSTATGFAAQSKIHSRNNVGASGKIYFATKQGYPDEKKKEKFEDYPGGYPMVYDPATGKTKVYPIAIKHQGIISITPDESRGIAYISTCADKRPESSHFMILDLAKGTYTDLMDCQHAFAFIVIDYLGRAYHPVLGGDIARYDPRSGKLERLKQTIDGKPPTEESRLALNNDKERGVLPGRSLGALSPGAKSTDCRGMCVGPKGVVWAALTRAYDNPKVPGNVHHLASYTPGEKAPRDHGVVGVRNPDFTPFKDAAGKDLAMHHGFHTIDGHFTSKFVILGVTQDLDGNVYSLALVPYTLLKTPAEQVK